jgi:NAD(P)H-flavin reductase
MNMHEILTRKRLNQVTTLFKVYAPQIARKARAGQFVIVCIHEMGERIPLTIAESDPEKGVITLVVQEIGKTTMEMCTMKEGSQLAVLSGPLGIPSEIRKYGTVICIGGGVGIAAIYPIAHALKEAGNTVLSIIGARTKNLLFWEDEMRLASHELIVCTDDGSYARKGVVTLPLKEILEGGTPIDRIWAIGPAIMMKYCAQTTKGLGIPTIVSLNSIMVDGTGMCGSCRVQVDNKTCFACVDGPEFDGHKVNWDLLMDRQRIYLKEENQALKIWKHKGGPLSG